MLNPSHALTVPLFTYWSQIILNFTSKKVAIEGLLVGHESTFKTQKKSVQKRVPFNCKAVFDKLINHHVLVYADYSAVRMA